MEAKNDAAVMEQLKQDVMDMGDRFPICGGGCGGGGGIWEQSQNRGTNLRHPTPYSPPASRHEKRSTECDVGDRSSDFDFSPTPHPLLPTPQHTMKKRFPYYPIYIDIADRNLLIVCSGTVCPRKAATMMRYGGRVAIGRPAI